VKVTDIEGKIETVREVRGTYKSSDLGTVKRIILKLILERERERERERVCKNVNWIQLIQDGSKYGVLIRYKPFVPWKTDN
jgi:hypothetical protein